MSIESNVERIIPVERAQLERAFIASADKLTTLYALSDAYNIILDLLEAAEDPEGTADLELELDRIDAKLDEVIQPRSDSVQIADAVIIAVLE